MTSIVHLNCGTLSSPFIDNAICHCMLLRDKEGYALVDTGFGMMDIKHPELRIGNALLHQFRPVLHEENTAIYQLKKLGIDPMKVSHCILSHLDFDHAGGLTDFPKATVHLSKEELVCLQKDSRYLISQFSHQPKFKSYSLVDRIWYGLPAYQVELGFASEILLVPLFGHTLGHCGVAIQQAHKWLFYAGDAYFSHEELDTENHQVTQQAAAAAADNKMRLASLRAIQAHLRDIEEIEIFCYHDPNEFKTFKTQNTI